LAHAAQTSLAIIRSAEGQNLRAKLQANIVKFSTTGTPIIPQILGSNEATLAASKALDQAGFLVPAIRFPTVPRGTARLRISLSAAHPPETVISLVSKISVVNRGKFID
jgi:8-amino-7-oxononanoate synthase